MVQMVLRPTSSPSAGIFPMALLANPRLRRMRENSCLELTLVSSCFLRLAMPNMACQLRRSMWYSWMQGSLQSRPPRKVVICLWNSSTFSCMMYSLGYFTTFLLISYSHSSIRTSISPCSRFAFSSQRSLLFLQGYFGCRNFVSMCSRKQTSAAVVRSRPSASTCELRLFCGLSPRDLSNSAMIFSLLSVSLRKLQASFSFMYQEEISRRNFLNLRLSMMFSQKPLKMVASSGQLGYPFSNSQSDICTLISSQVMSTPVRSMMLNSPTKSSRRHFRRLFVWIHSVRSFLRSRMDSTAWQMRWMEPSSMSNPLKMILSVVSSLHSLSASLRYSMKFFSMRSLQAGKQPYPQHLKASSTKGGVLPGTSSVESSCLKSRKFLEAKNSLLRSWDLLNSFIEITYAEQPLQSIQLEEQAKR